MADSQEVTSYQDYLEDIKYLEGYLQREFPRFYKRIKEEINEFWYEVRSNIPELKKSSRIKKEILGLVTSTINYQLLYDSELEKDARTNERRGTKANTKAYLDSYLDMTIDGVLALPKFFLIAFSKNLKKDSTHIENLEKQIRELREERQRNSPLVDRAKQMSGRKIDPDKLELYRLIDAKHKTLLAEYGPGHQASIKKATKLAIKDTGGEHLSYNLVRKTSKSFSKYFNKHPIQFI